MNIKHEFRFNLTSFFDDGFLPFSSRRRLRDGWKRRRRSLEKENTSSKTKKNVVRGRHVAGNCSFAGPISTSHGGELYKQYSFMGKAFLLVNINHKQNDSWSAPLSCLEIGCANNQKRLPGLSAAQLNQRGVHGGNHRQNMLQNFM